MAEGGFFAGSIFAKLLLDKTGWNTSVVSVGKDTKTLGGFIDKFGGQIAGIGKRMVLTGATIVTSLGAMIVKTANYGDEINDMSKRTGVAVETLSGYKLAVDKSGTSLGALAIGMKGLAGQMQAANDGGKESKRLFDSLGISYTDNEGRLRPLNDVMLDVADRFSGMEDGALKTALAQDIFGRSGMELIPMLNLGAEGLKKEREEADRLGMTLTTKSAQGCDDFNDSLAGLKGATSSAVREIGMALLPVVKDLTEKITGIVSRVREWIAEHPTLTGWIARAGLAIGGLMTVIGPLLLALPHLISGLRTFKGLDLGKRLVGQFQGLGDKVGGLSTVLKKLPAIGAAAFVGWNVGRLIGEITGANKAIEGTFSNLIDKAGLYKGKAEEADLTTERLAKRQLFLAKASEISGRQITSLNEAMDIIRGTFEKSGTTGNVVLDEWAKKSSAAQKAVDEHRKKVGLLIPTIDEAAKKQKTWGEILQEYGVIPLKEKKERIAELLGHEERLIKMFKDGTIDSKEYGEGILAINGLLKDLGSTTEVQVLPPARDMADIWKQAPGQIDGAAYAIGGLEDQMKAYGDEMGFSTNTVRAFIYEIQRMRLATMGIVLPPLDFSSWTEGAERTASDMYQPFDQLWSDVAGSFGDAVEGMLFEGDTLKEGWRGICDSMKEAISSMIGEMVTKWVKGLLTDMVGAATEAAASTGTAFSGLGATVGTIATTIGTVITTLATAVATAIGTIATGIGTALVTLATAIATAATILAAAIVPLATIGALAVALYAAFKLVGAAIDKLLGLGGGDSKASAWIHETRDFAAEIRNEMVHVNPNLDYIKDKLLPEKLQGIRDAVLEKGSAIFGAVNTTRNEICKRLDKIVKNTGEIGSAQSGAVVTDTRLMRLHGTPSAPEYVIPTPDLQRMTAGMGAVHDAGKSVTVNVMNEVHVDGQIITDRDYVRGRVIPELIQAMRSAINKSELQAALGLK